MDSVTKRTRRPDPFFGQARLGDFCHHPDSSKSKLEFFKLPYDIRSMIYELIDPPFLSDEAKGLMLACSQLKYEYENSTAMKTSLHLYRWFANVQHCLQLWCRGWSPDLPRRIPRTLSPMSSLKQLTLTIPCFVHELMTNFGYFFDFAITAILPKRFDKFTLKFVLDSGARQDHKWMWAFVVRWASRYLEEAYANPCCKTRQVTLAWDFRGADPNPQDAMFRTYTYYCNREPSRILELERTQSAELFRQFNIGPPTPWEIPKDGASKIFVPTKACTYRISHDYLSGEWFFHEINTKRTLPRNSRPPHHLIGPRF